MKFRVPKSTFLSHFSHILDIMASNPSKIINNGDSIHCITQVDDSGDEGDSMEFPPLVFGGVLMQL